MWQHLPAKICEQTNLVELGVEYIESVERSSEDDAVGDPSDAFILPRDHGEVDDDPENQTGSHLVERLDVE